MRKVSKKLLIRCIVLGMVAFTLYITHEITLSLSLICADDGAKEIIRNLCLLYKNNIAAGNLCPDLCETGNLQYVSCFNYHKGKAVFRATWNGEPVVLKSKYDKLTNYERPVSTILDADGGWHTAVPDIGLFKSMVYHHVKGLFGFELELDEDQVLARMWSDTRRASDSDNLMEPEITSLWALLQQEEYVMFQYWRGFPHYPGIHGSCGHFYVLEYVPPGFILNPSTISVQQQLVSLPWRNRAKIAMAMMTFISALDEAFPEKLHLCDVKHDNFGVSEDLVVKAIDVDISFFQRMLDSTLSQPSCSQDEDCHFFDCRGMCNSTTKMCNKNRANTNLQAVCADIFTRHYGTPGLLRYPPTQVAGQIDAAIQECLQQKGLNSADTKISETAVYKRLFQLLEESLKYIDR